MAGEKLEIRGVTVWQGAIAVERQEAMIAEVRKIAAEAPFVRPVTRRGTSMSVRMTSAGSFGWISDRRGYRYTTTHPDGQPWPRIPDSFLALWHEYSGVDRLPECCLVNWYGEGARMGLHQDRDEADLGQPVLSVSLGDDCLFRVGNEERGGPTESLWLSSGDVVLMSGRGRMLHHGVDRIRFGSSSLLPKGGRVNLTFRVVT